MERGRGAVTAELEMPDFMPRILVLDDEEAMRLLLSTIISKRGFCCDTAASLQDARGLLEKNRYDILLLDLKLLNQEFTRDFFQEIINPEFVCTGLHLTD